MSAPPLSIDDFKTELSNRYSDPVTQLRSPTELIHLLDQRQVFLNASIFMELMEQVQLIVAKLGQLAVENGIEIGFDLSEQGKLVCAKLLEYGQKLPFSLPQAVVSETMES